MSGSDRTVENRTEQSKNELEYSEKKPAPEINELDFEKLWENSCSTDIIEYARKTF